MMTKDREIELLQNLIEVLQERVEKLKKNEQPENYFYAFIQKSLNTGNEEVEKIMDTYFKLSDKLKVDLKENIRYCFENLVNQNYDTEEVIAYLGYLNRKEVEEIKNIIYGNDSN